VTGPDGQQILSWKYAIIRTDYWKEGSGTIFGIVTNGYTILQNREAFTFFDDIVGQDAVIYHIAGVLGQG
jgi:hypothetical protein